MLEIYVGVGPIDTQDHHLTLRTGWGSNPTGVVGSGDDSDADGDDGEDGHQVNGGGGG